MIIMKRCGGKKTPEYVKQKCYSDWKTVATSGTVTAQKMKFSIKNFFSKCDQICSSLRIWLDLLKKSLMETLILCAVTVPDVTTVFQ